MPKDRTLSELLRSRFSPFAAMFLFSFICTEAFEHRMTDNTRLQSEYWPAELPKGTDCSPFLRGWPFVNGYDITDKVTYYWPGVFANITFYLAACTGTLIAIEYLRKHTITSFQFSLYNIFVLVTGAALAIGLLRVWGHTDQFLSKLQVVRSDGTFFFLFFGLGFVAWAILISQCITWVLMWSIRLVSGSETDR